MTMDNHRRPNAAEHTTDYAPGSSISRKISFRIVPMLFLAALLSYVDRTNIGVAKLQMQNDLGLSEAAFGLGAGVFFIAYVLFEVPSNIALHRIGARIWIARIMITWGLVTALMSLVENIWMFYGMRFLLGAAEAGLLPGVVYYLTRWVPSANRGRILGLFFLAIPVASAIGSPLTSTLMSVNLWGLAGWQFMFIAEGLPCLLLAAVIVKFLPNEPGDARWLNASEAQWLTAKIDQEDPADTGGGTGHPHWTAGLKNYRVLMLAAVYFSMVVPIYLMGFFLPSIIKEMTGGTVGTTGIGYLAAVPYVFTGIAMVLISRSSDRTQERMWHFVVPTLAGACAWVIAAATVSSSPYIAAIAICVGTIGSMATIPTFWTTAPKIVSGAAAASGIALISSIGNIGGFVSPYMFGIIRDAFPGEAGNRLSFLVGAIILGIGGLIMIAVSKTLRPTTPTLSKTKQLQHD
ncbi:MFS transporter [Rhodococcus sp. WB9]|uniref:MFS transporter n=1 Tax=Rhodococcus sp. WB9 TaxID=2594007 RepID=UPI0011866AAD|nr:MFS transporter [Rhodococcus sp. WB9]QDQ90260.1 MFS transporter [Rhodococcus sp. WB9]